LRTCLDGWLCAFTFLLCSCLVDFTHLLFRSLENKCHQCRRLLGSSDYGFKVWWPASSQAPAASQKVLVQSRVSRLRWLRHINKRIG
jgi:hypothetical protein